MGRFVLDELECDEIHAALIERRADLNKRKTKLLEDGLPEAAEGIDKRLRLYDSHDGPDSKPRAGLVRMFAPQRDVESEAEQTGRDRDGQQDIFGGGAETGGARRAGGATTVDSSAPGDNAGDEVIDVDYEIIPEGRRIAAKSTLTIESALNILSQIARILLAGPAKLDEADYLNFANAVLVVVPAMNPGVDPEYVRAHVLEELAAADDNAHGLAHYVQRNVDAICDLRDNPPAPKGDRFEHGQDPFVELSAEELGDLDDDEREEYQAEKATHDEAIAAAEREKAEREPGAPVSDAVAAALRGVVFPQGAEPTDGGLTFETPGDRGETDAPEGETKGPESETKPGAGETTDQPDAAGGKAKGTGKKRGRKPKK